MARIPSRIIDDRRTSSSLEDLEKDVSRKKNALTRANYELQTAEAAFDKEAKKVRGVLIENYPQSYWDADVRRDNALAKRTQANEAYEVACERYDTVRQFTIDEAHEAATIAERDFLSLGA